MSEQGLRVTRRSNTLQEAHISESRHEKSEGYTNGHMIATI